MNKITHTTLVLSLLAAPGMLFADQPAPDRIESSAPELTGAPIIKKKAPKKWPIPMQGTRYMWTFGFDVFGMYVKPRGDFNYVFTSNKVGSTLYLAQRFRNPFGYEVGFSWTDRKPKGFPTVPGTEAFNNVATTTAEDTGRLRLKTTYLDLQAHYRMCKQLEGKFLIGIGWVRQSLEFTYVPNIGSGDPIQAALKNMEGRTATSLRLGIGGQTLLTKRTGLRFLVIYETMSAIKIRGTPAGVSQQILNNSISANFGIYWVFQGLNPEHSIYPHND